MLYEVITKVADQRSVRLAVGEMDQRQVRDLGLGRRRGDQRCERVIVHDARDRGPIVRREMRGYVEAHSGESGKRRSVRSRNNFV